MEKNWRKKKKKKKKVAKKDTQSFIVERKMKN